MLSYFLSIVLYFYISIFKPKLKVDFPCQISPFFAYRIDKNMKNVNLGSAFIGRNVQISDLDILGNRILIIRFNEFYYEEYLKEMNN